MGITIRIPLQTHEQLRRLAAARKQPIGQVVAAAVDQLETNQFWEEMKTAFEELYADPTARAEYEAEHRDWDATLVDGLHDAPYYEDGEE